MSGRRLAQAIALFFKQSEAERMATAQQRAALPKDQGGLGLPEDNTAAQRADAMFPTSVWRGMRDVNLFATPELTEGQRLMAAFDRTRTYPRAGNSYRSDDVVFSTPSNALAQTYGPNVYPMRLDTRGYLNADFEGRNYRGLDFDHNDLDAYPPEAWQAMNRDDSDLTEFAADLTIYDAAGNDLANLYRATTDDIAEWIGDPSELSLDYGENLVEFGTEVDEIPGVRLDNIVDIGGQYNEMPPYVKQQLKEPQTVYLGRNNQYRHVDAAFDPFLKQWDHIFAGAAGMGVLLDKLPADEEKQGVLAQ